MNKVAHPCPPSAVSQQTSLKTWSHEEKIHSPFPHPAFRPPNLWLIFLVETKSNLILYCSASSLKVDSAQLPAMFPLVASVRVVNDGEGGSPPGDLSSPMSGRWHRMERGCVLCTPTTLMQWVGIEIVTGWGTKYYFINGHWLAPAQECSPFSISVASLEVGFTCCNGRSDDARILSSFGHHSSAHRGGPQGPKSLL